MIKILLWNVRTEKDLTLEELSKLSGVSTSSLNRYECGEVSPTLDKLEKIAAALNVSMSDLFKSEHNY